MYLMNTYKVTIISKVFGIGSVIYTGIEIGVHWEYFLGCVNNQLVIRYAQN